MDMDTVWREAAQHIGNPDALLEYIESLPEDIRKLVLNDMMVTKSKHFKWHRDRERQFKEEHGVTRAWLYALNNPEYRERRRDYAREYQRKRRATLATTPPIATQTNLGARSAPAAHPRCALAEGPMT